MSLLFLIIINAVLGALQTFGVLYVFDNSRRGALSNASAVTPAHKQWDVWLTILVASLPGLGAIVIGFAPSLTELPASRAGTIVGMWLTAVVFGFSEAHRIFKREGEAARKRAWEGKLP